MKLHRHYLGVTLFFVSFVEILLCARVYFNSEFHQPVSALMNFPLACEIDEALS